MNRVQATDHGDRNQITRQLAVDDEEIIDLVRVVDSSFMVRGREIDLPRASNSHAVPSAQ
jgi:hypothetical protein